MSNAVRKMLADTQREEIEKRARFAKQEEELRAKLAELKDKDTVVNINPDVTENNTASDVLHLLDKVAKFLSKEHYEAAESLLRHIYRSTPSLNARKALASARRLCREAVKLENKWVRRRATLLRRKESTSTIRAEKKKYVVDHRSEIADYLSTATLEVAEGVERRGGDYYVKLASSFEVVLPKMHEGDSLVVTRAPVMFNAKSFLDERMFKEVMAKSHGGLDPGLKRIERGFFVCKAIAMVGLPLAIESMDGNKAKREKQLRKYEKLLSEKLGRASVIVGYTMVHRSSKLFWYAYDFPVEVEVMQFADMQVAENYGEHNTALLQMDNGKLSRDQFVNLRENARRRSVLLKSMQLREQRMNFVNTHDELFKQIEDLRDVFAEMSEKMAAVRKQFEVLTATQIDDEQRTDGLPIGQYKKLYGHTFKMYKVLAEIDTGQRDRLHGQLFEDRMKARELYYEYREMNARRAEFSERIAFLTALIEEKRNVTRGTGKNLQVSLEMFA